MNGILLMNWLAAIRGEMRNWRTQFHPPGELPGVPDAMFWLENDELGIAASDEVRDGRDALHLSIGRWDRRSPTDQDVQRIKDVFLAGSKDFEFRDWQGVGPKPIAHLFCFDPPQDPEGMADLLAKAMFKTAK